MKFSELVENRLKEVTKSIKLSNDELVNAYNNGLLSILKSRNVNINIYSNNNEAKEIEDVSIDMLLISDIEFESYYKPISIKETKIEKKFFMNINKDISMIIFFDAEKESLDELIDEEIKEVIIYINKEEENEINEFVLVKY